MTKRGVLLLLDTVMLFSFMALMSWRLTGVPLHERLALFLLGLIVAHVIIHWGWVETRVRKAVRSRSWRSRVNVALNAILFAAMGTALTTGFFMSKVVLPNRLSPGAYLNWHQAHDISSTTALVILGLHVALNWDLITAGLRRVRRPVSAVRHGAPTGRGVLARSLRGLAWLVAASALLPFVTWKVGGLVPPQSKILIEWPGGRTEEVPPPADLTALTPGTDRPSLLSGAVPFVVRFGMLSIVALAGRRVLKLRLD